MNIEEYMLSNPARIESVRSRLQAKLKENIDTGCIEWVARARANGGYGTLCVGRRGQIRAHRAAWVLANGPIPIGVYVCHSCDNPSCCNVDHLFLGTPLENMEDKESKGRGTKPPIAFGAKHHKTTLSESDVTSISGDRRSLAVLSKKYGVSTKTIWRIKKGLTWKKSLCPPMQ